MKKKEIKKVEEVKPQSKKKEEIPHEIESLSKKYNPLDIEIFLDDNKVSCAKRVYCSGSDKEGYRGKVYLLLTDQETNDWVDSFVNDNESTQLKVKSAGIVCFDKRVRFNDVEFSLDIEDTLLTKAICFTS